MISFDTDGLKPNERFDHWCEVRAKGLFGITIEVSRERRRHFQGRFSAFEMGGATVAEMKASSYRASRTWLTSSVCRATAFTFPSSYAAPACSEPARNVFTGSPTAR